MQPVHEAVRGRAASWTVPALRRRGLRGGEPEVAFAVEARLAACSFGDLVEGMARTFPPSLLSGQGLQRLVVLAGRLPLCVIDQLFGFEFALGQEAPDADFCVVPARGSDLAAHYIRAGQAAAAGSPAAFLGLWLARDASDPESFLARRNGRVILEYDVPRALRDEPAPPGLFFVPRTVEKDAAPTLHDDPADTIAALRTAAGWRADAEESRQVARVYEALPSAGYVSQAGVLPGRPRRAVRLVVHRIDAVELPGLLRRIGWPGSPDVPASVMADVSDVVGSRVALSIDVAACGVSPRLGLELFLPGEPFRTGRAGWRPMIDRLVDRAWCLPAKAAGLGAWPGAARLIGPGGIYRIRRYVNHVKVVVRGDRIAAKAYAAMFVRPLLGK